MALIALFAPIARSTNRSTHSMVITGCQLQNVTADSAAATFVAPTMLADSGHVACSTVHEAWIRLHGHQIRRSPAPGKMLMPGARSRSLLLARSTWGCSRPLWASPPGPTRSPGPPPGGWAPPFTQCRRSSSSCRGSSWGRSPMARRRRRSPLPRRGRGIAFPLTSRPESFSPAS